MQFILPQTATPAGERQMLADAQRKLENCISIKEIEALRTIVQYHQLALQALTQPIDTAHISLFDPDDQHPIRRGDRVHCWMNKQFSPGIVTHIKRDGTLVIRTDRQARIGQGGAGQHSNIFERKSHEVRRLVSAAAIVPRPLA